MNLNSHLGTFDPKNFCIDFAIDYCSSDHEPRLRAIINNKDLLEDNLLGNKLTTVFGSNAHDGPKLILFKQIGYSVTIFFLLLTIALHVVIADIRKVSKS